LAVLQLDPIFRGIGLPRGDGRVVLVIPGLFGNDLYLRPMHLWLRRLGYWPVASRLAFNAGCPNRLRGEVEGVLERAARRRPGPVALIGHSRGGMLAWALASRLQDRASHLILLGSPAPSVVAMIRAGINYTTAPTSDIAVNPVAMAGRRSLQLLDPDCNVPDCGCPYIDDLRRHLSALTGVLSVLSRDDRIVSPSACRVSEGTNVEVGGTHSGLVYSREVYPIVARFLATRE
jgi:pimeloyl-ACP methyl ester carboxylesterase